MDTTSLPALVKVRELSRSGEARSIRLDAGVSLGEVARAIDVSRTTVLRWERGDRTPRGDAAIRYGELLAALAAVGRTAA